MILSAPDDVYSHICLLFGQLIQLSGLNIFRLCCGHTHTHTPVLAWKMEKGIAQPTENMPIALIFQDDGNAKIHPRKKQ